MNLLSTELAIRELAPHSANLTKAMLWVTSFGNWKWVLAAAILVSALCLLNSQRKKVAPFVLSLAGTEITVELLKLAVHRVRPIGGSFLESSFSFPSGHSAIAVALYGFVAYLLLKRTRSRTGKGLLLTATLMIILLIGFSRIYLGAHYPTDVLGGYLVGALWLWVAIRAARRAPKPNTL